MKALTLGFLIMSLSYTSQATASESDSSKLSTKSSSKPSSEQTQCASWLNHSIPQLHSNDTIELCEATAGKTVLMVNTASHCGFTGQFGELEKLYQDYKDQGLVIVGFPSNDFKQEAKTEEEAAKVCFYNYGVSFLMAKPISVRGKDAHPIFQHLAKQTGKPKWNFYKYLIDKDGNVVDWFSSMDSPDSDKIVRAIERTL